MSKALAGVQRIELQEAAADLKALSAQLARHRKACRQCVSMGIDRNRYCTEGWDLVKAEHHARGRYRRARQALDPQQETLF